MHQKLFIKITCLFMISVLLIASAPLYTIAALEPFVDYHDFYSMVSDPPTSRFANYFSSSTIDDGRIWVDKTVSTDTITFYDHIGNPTYTIDSKPDEFLITLSALSQSYYIDTVEEPTDTVFILDISGSMHIYQLGSDTRDRKSVV